MKKTVIILVFAMGAIVLLLLGADAPDELRWRYSAWLGLWIGAFIWLRRTAWYKKHKDKHDEMIRSIRAELEADKVKRQ